MRQFLKDLVIQKKILFEGRKELFEGLYIYNKVTEWKQYPVIRLDLSNGNLFSSRSQRQSPNCRSWGFV